MGALLDSLAMATIGWLELIETPPNELFSPGELPLTTVIPAGEVRPDTPKKVALALAAMAVVCEKVTAEPVVGW